MKLFLLMRFVVVFYFCAESIFASFFSFWCLVYHFHMIPEKWLVRRRELCMISHKARSFWMLFFEYCCFSNICDLERINRVNRWLLPDLSIHLLQMPVTRCWTLEIHTFKESYFCYPELIACCERVEKSKNKSTDNIFLIILLLLLLISVYL